MARAPASLEIEDVPEADRLDGFPPPRETDRLFGHDAAGNDFARAFLHGRMHHALLLTGAEGIGKATLAYKIAAFVLAQPRERQADRGLAVPADSVARRQVRAMSHPSLLVMRRQWVHKDKRFTASLPIEEVRRLRGFLQHHATGDGWRVVLVDTADELNINAANALLKMLEEPPTRTLFLLLSAEPGRLLPTIRSRCRLLPLSAPAGEPFRAAVSQALAAAEREGVSPGDWDTLERLSDGSIKKALGLTAAGLDLYRAILKLMSSLPQTDWLAAHAISDELQYAPANDRFELFFDLLLGLLGRMIRCIATGRGDPEEAELARTLIPAARLATWAELWDTIVRDKAQVLALNLDRKLLILETISRLETVARR